MGEVRPWRWTSNLYHTGLTAEVSVTATELAMILGGVEVRDVRQRPRYHPWSMVELLENGGV